MRNDTDNFKLHAIGFYRSWHKIMAKLYYEHSQEDRINFVDALCAYAFEGSKRRFSEPILAFAFDIIEDDIYNYSKALTCDIR